MHGSLQKKKKKGRWYILCKTEKWTVKNLISNLPRQHWVSLHAMWESCNTTIQAQTWKPGTWPGCFITFHIVSMSAWASEHHTTFHRPPPWGFRFLSPEDQQQKKRNPCLWNPTVYNLFTSLLNSLERKYSMEKSFISYHNLSLEFQLWNTDPKVTSQNTCCWQLQLCWPKPSTWKCQPIHTCSRFRTAGLPQNNLFRLSELQKGVTLFLKEKLQKQIEHTPALKFLISFVLITLRLPIFRARIEIWQTLHHIQEKTL